MKLNHTEGSSLSYLTLRQFDISVVAHVEITAI